MTKKSSKNLLEAVDTIIGQDVFIKGTINTDKTVRIDGHFVGNVEKALGVLVGAQAVIEGNITAEAVMVAGTVKGNITAGESIEILPKAKVNGDIKTGILTISEGAFFEGKSLMTAKQEENSEVQAI